MGAKTWMIAGSDGDASEILKSDPELDREATASLARRLFPDEKLVPESDGSLLDTCPGDDELVVGCFPGLSIVAAAEVGIDYPSKLPAIFRDGSLGRTIHLVAMHSVVDWLAFVSLTSLGVDIGVANVVARLCGAAFGYVLNGTVTFSSEGARVIGVGSGARFVTTWCAMTLLGTLALVALNSLQLAPAWLMKLVVEACLAVVSFVVMRTWVYGRSVPATT